MPNLNRFALAAFSVSLVLASASNAFAEEGVRTGLGGSFTSRGLTVPQNSITIIGGPGQTVLIGQRFGANTYDGGFAHRRFSLSGDANLASANQSWFRGGVAFGLFDNFEMGALFLTFRLDPDFAWSDFPVYFTYTRTFDNIVVGGRLSFTTPVEGDLNWNPGIPLVVHMGKGRIDTGVFAPILTGDETVVGLTIPIRYSMSVTPQIFWGVHSGFAEPSFDASNDMSLPLGALLGYTTVFGKRVVDFSGGITWDDFLLVSPPDGVDAIQAGSFRVMLGASFHSLAM